MFKVYSKKEDVPQALLEHYAEKDGKWVPQLEGGGAGDDDGDKGKLAEFRSNNLKLQSQIDELKQKLGTFSDIGDPAKAREAMETIRRMNEDAELSALLGDKPDSKTIRAAAEKLAEARAKARIEELNTQLKLAQEGKGTIEKSYADLQARFGKTALATALTSALSKANMKLRKNAHDAAVRLAADHWEVDAEGKFTSKGVFDKDAKPLTSLEQFVDHMKTNADFLFEPASGGGSGGGGGGGLGRPSLEGVKRDESGNLVLTRNAKPS